MYIVLIVDEQRGDFENGAQFFAIDFVLQTQLLVLIKK